jgi:hypothetical protein
LASFWFGSTFPTSAPVPGELVSPAGGGFEYAGADTDNDDIVTDIPESASEVVNLPTNEVVLPVLNFSIAAKAVTSLV